MKQLSVEAKEAIVKQALGNSSYSHAEIARMNNIGYSTLKKWLKAVGEGKPLKSSNRTVRRQGFDYSSRFNHVFSTSNLDEEAIGIYCREQGIYSHQLSQWREELMANSGNKKNEHQLSELRKAKSEIKSLKKELRRKEKALAEASALLILKKKADLIWGDQEDD